MPSTGTPADHTLAGARGASPSMTLFGPPERMMPAGANFLTNDSGNVERMDFAIHVQLAHPARDELGVLSAEIENQNGRVHGRHRAAEDTEAAGALAKWRRASQKATACSSALTKKVTPTRQSSDGKWLTAASRGVPIKGATTNMMLLIEFSAPMVTPCSRGSTALETTACSAGPCREGQEVGDDDRVHHPSLLRQAVENIGGDSGRQPGECQPDVAEAPQQRPQQALPARQPPPGRRKTARNRFRVCPSRNGSG